MMGVLHRRNNYENKQVHSCLLYTSVAGAVGKNGFVTVIKDLGLKEPYIGKTPIVSGAVSYTHLDVYKRQAFFAVSKAVS